ncbi:MAG: NAD-dependent deacylase [Pseudomonadota bacterium]
MSTAPSIVILTGAGISAESGIDTFRDKGGLWEQHPVEEVATPEAFARNPTKVHDFYNMRRAGLSTVEPNAAHFALAQLEKEHDGAVLVVTQNVDNLHERAGSENLIHMHGELAKALCTNCGARHDWLVDLDEGVVCPACSRAGGMRPDVVWFGEYPYQMERIWDALAACDLFVSIGTSGNVYPAAQFVQQAKRASAKTLELNLEPSEGMWDFDDAVHGPATQIVPQWVANVLKA